MTGSEFKHRLRLLGRTQVGFASEIGVTERTVHNWASKGPPAEIRYLIDTMTSLEMPFGPHHEVVRDLAAEKAFARSATIVMNQLAEQAARTGAGREFIDAVRLWIGQTTDQAKSEPSD
ncbi:hypothetical protein JHFBIEKO_4910 [Methylobacterium mesophilicum]|uniref:hypothetical protein n=1 Tax=Methylobacterium TaxID=407 RepID=UPI0011C8D347|nr:MULTISPECIES: hypothetical protein [Methylobacterium]TXN81489.1 hypothetical protein FV234_13175 [Methylobacterium sp. WL8]GJE24437.1 hypothetical protein JHFBIEKO_4910 [Methylobacterium mesophilicum]